ncbi:MAG: hypothetical protein ACLR7D_02715 [Lachnospira eligens]
MMVSNTTEARELALVADTFNMEKKDVKKLIMNGVEAAFTTEGIKNRLRARGDTVCQSGRNQRLGMNEVNELFTKENVEKIYVPDIAKDDLLSIIEEKLKKAGFYYRVAYRVKAPDSMLDKLILKDYRRL